MAGAWKEAGGGKTEVGEVTNALESPPEALLKGLLGERAIGCWEADPALELNGLGKFPKVWELETASTPGELAGVELDESLLPKIELYCGGPLGGAAVEGVSEKTLSSCNTAAYLSWLLELLTGGVVWLALTGCCCCCCGWDRDWGRDCC